MAAHSGFAAGIAVLVSLALPAAGAAQGVQRTHGPDPAPSALAPVATTAAAGDWCGGDGAGAHQVNNGEYRYRAVYVHAADSGSRLSALGAQLQDDAFAASALLERQYGRAIRYDVGTACGPEMLDISEVRLPLTQTELAALAAAGGTATFDAVANALRAQGFAIAANDAGPTELATLRENFLVWLDGPAPARSCGQGTALLDSTRSETNLNNMGGKLAVIFRPGRDICGADVVRHEIGHNLGALQPDAPNTTDGVHCNDAFEDTMCAWEAPKLVGGPFNGLYFDHGNDDYWDPPQGAPLGWWTVNLSRFICPDARCNRPAASPRRARHRRANARDRRARAARRRQGTRGRSRRHPLRAGQFGQ
jgi:hypothetical protein